MNEMDIFAWLDGVNVRIMQFTNVYWWPIMATLLFTGSLVRMVPFQMHYTHSFTQVMLIYVRKTIVWGVVILLFYPLVMLFLFLMVPATQPEPGARSPAVFWQWLVSLARENWTLPVNALALGILLNLLASRYVYPVWSALMRKIRVRQFYDVQSDIRKEATRFKAKHFVPKTYYRKGQTFIGLDEANRPIHVPLDTWRETNMQIIGPTRFGKGVILGTLMDQAIRRGDSLMYIDPKDDKFAPHILYQACVETGRPFYYLTLHDHGVGSWAPFAGGALRDGLNRLELSFGLELTGEAGSDFYKSQERRLLERAFAENRDIQDLYRVLEETEARRILAELAQWRSLRSLCPSAGEGFEVARALQEDAVVYLQGHLFDSVVKAATKAFIVELIQESRRLARERNTHLTVAVDEVSFLTSKPLAQALATSVGFQCNFILAYQSQKRSPEPGRSDAQSTVHLSEHQRELATQSGVRRRRPGNRRMGRLPVRHHREGHHEDGANGDQRDRRRVVREAAHVGLTGRALHSPESTPVVAATRLRLLPARAVGGHRVLFACGGEG